YEPPPTALLCFSLHDALPISCNLQTDATGDVRPGARAVDARAAVAIPVRDAHGQLRAVVGIAFLGERELTPSELARLEMTAAARSEEHTSELQAREKIGCRLL